MQTAPLSSSPTQWQAVLDACPSVPVDYTPNMITYQQTYFGYTDLSCTFIHEGKPVGVFILSDNLTSNGQGILPPLVIPAFRGTSLHRKLIRECLLMAHSPSAAVTFRSYAIDQWHLELMAQGGRINAVYHDLWVDLSLPIEQIKSCFRKQYRNSINQGRVELRYEIIHRGSPLIPLQFNRFQEFHTTVAGRETRSVETWLAQELSLMYSDDFIVKIFNNSDLVGAALFSTSKSHASYSVAAYDRNLPDLPIGHISLMAAIEHAKALGKRWLYLGRRHYPQDTPTPTEKEVSISYFKRGFATDITPQFVIKLEG
jgi:FemAB family protein